MKVIHSNRIKVDKTDMIHFESKVGYCAVCGAAATHIYFGHTPKGTKKKGKIYLCTLHFVQIFKVPPQRFPKKERKHVKPVLPKVREFSLRRHMDFPFTFTGERLVSKETKLPCSTVFMALYAREAGNSPKQDEFRHVLSIARVWGKKHAVNLVRVIGGVDDVVRTMEGLLGELNAAAPMKPDVFLRLQMDATKFMEECLSQKSRRD